MRRQTGFAIALLGTWPMSAWASQAVTFPADAPIVEHGTVNRESAQKDEHGAFHPPWRSVEVFVGLPRAISPGDAITVLPLRQGLPPLQATATSVRFQQGVPEEMPDLWLVDIDVKAQAFFAARPDRGRRDDTPFDVIVVYPAQTQARLLAPAASAKESPAGAWLFEANVAGGRRPRRRRQGGRDTVRVLLRQAGEPKDELALREHVPGDVPPPQHSALASRRGGLRRLTRVLASPGTRIGYCRDAD